MKKIRFIYNFIKILFLFLNIYIYYFFLHVKLFLFFFILYFFLIFFFIEVFCFSRSSINFFIFIIIKKNGNTSLIIAAEKGHFEIVKSLIENNADINIQDNVFYFFILFFYYFFYLFLK
jgi:hypothetical protein